MIRSLDISSDVKNINQVRLFLEQIFVELNLNQSCFNQVFLCLSEALTNSIVHGNRSVDSKMVHISISFSGRELFIEIADEGDGFSFENISDPTCAENIRRESGRGIFLIRHFAKELVYMDGGRKVLIKYLLENEY